MQNFVEREIITQIALLYFRNVNYVIDILCDVASWIGLEVCSISR